MAIESTGTFEVFFTGICTSFDVPDRLRQSDHLCHVRCVRTQIKSNAHYLVDLPPIPSWWSGFDISTTDRCFQQQASRGVRTFDTLSSRTSCFERARSV